MQNGTVKTVGFTQIEKHIQIFAMFRNSATVKSNISVFIKNLNFRNNYREKISQTDRLNVTVKKNSDIYDLRIISKT